MENEKLAFDDNGKIIPIQKTQMLEIGTDKFIMRSKDWSSNKDTVIDQQKIMIPYREGIVIANFLSIREYPKASGVRLGKVYTNDKIKIYNYGLQHLTNNFFSINPPIIENGQIKLDEDGNPVFPEGPDAGKWLAEQLDEDGDGVYKYYWRFDENEPIKYEEIIIPNKQSGQEIDVGEGRIFLQSSDILALEINAKALDYPFQLGVLNGETRNFKIGWDGSLHGGTGAGKWSIDKNGKAVFGLLYGEGGSLTTMDIEECNVHNVTVSGNFTYNSKSVIPTGINITYLIPDSSLLFVTSRNRHKIRLTKNDKGEYSLEECHDSGTGQYTGWDVVTSAGVVIGDTVATQATTSSPYVELSGDFMGYDYGTTSHNIATGGSSGSTIIHRPPSSRPSYDIM